MYEVQYLMHKSSNPYFLPMYQNYHYLGSCMCEHKCVGERQMTYADDQTIKFVIEICKHYKTQECIMLLMFIIPNN